jgi:hypothetical protein
MADKVICTKHSYKTSGSANRKLRQLRKKRDRLRGQKVEDHAYRCQHCGRWHLTSQTRWHTD